MALGDPEPSFTSRCWQTDEEDSDRQFAIVADPSRADMRTLDVYHEPDRICLSVDISEERDWEREIIVPRWVELETTEAIINNGILTVTVDEH